MPELAPVDRSQLHRAFMAAFADYAMDASGIQEDRLLLRMQKNAVDFTLSPGLYDGDRLAGFTLIGVDSWGGTLTAFDAGTGIVPEFRKQGWARRMFDHALPALRERGVSRFALEVLQENEPAIKAYRKSGFEIVRAFRCYLAQAENLPKRRSTENVEVREIDRDTVRSLEPSADWLPSFENRFTAIDALPGLVELRGAFVDAGCVGALAYSPALNWPITLLVREDHRRRGIGTALIASLSSLLPAGAKHVVVQNVDEGDAAMQAFFGSVGFTPLVNQYEMVRELQTLRS